MSVRCSLTSMLPAMGLALVIVGWATNPVPAQEKPESESQSLAVDTYLKSLAPVPSPHLIDGRLSPAAQRGEELFFDPKVGCAACHTGPGYTDKKLHNVASQGKLDDPNDKFTTPRLIEVWRTAPYMHDGQYLTVKELLVEGKHGHNADEAAQLSDAEIDDLVEFVLSL